MCKKMLPLLFTGLILLGLLLMPRLKTTCNHGTYIYINDCTIRICTTCGIINTLTYSDHRMDWFDCQTLKCIHCGKTEQSDYHQANRRCISWTCPLCGQIFKGSDDQHRLEYIVTDQCTAISRCMDCGKIIKQHEAHTSRLKEISPCTYARQCINCGIITGELTESHTFRATTCGEPYRCVNCGIANNTITKHTYFSGFTPLFTYCVGCDYVGFMDRPVDWFLLAAELLGVLWIVLVFGYAIRERRKFFLDRQLLRSALLENPESCIGHCPITPMLRSAEEAPPF